MCVWLPGTVVGTHKIFVEQMNFISPLSRNDTGIFKQNKMPLQYTAIQPPTPQSLGWISRCCNFSVFGPENHKELPAGSASLARVHWPSRGQTFLAQCASQRMKLLGNVPLSPPWSQDDFIMEIPYSPVRTISQVEGLGPSDLCGPGWSLWDLLRSGAAGGMELGLPPLPHISQF